MQQRAMLMRNACTILDRLNAANLVVGLHHAHEDRTGRSCLLLALCQSNVDVRPLAHRHGDYGA